MKSSRPPLPPFRIFAEFLDPGLVGRLLDHSFSNQARFQATTVGGGSDTDTERGGSADMHCIVSRVYYFNNQPKAFSGGALPLPVLAHSQHILNLSTLNSRITRLSCFLPGSCTRSCRLTAPTNISSIHGSRSIAGCGGGRRLSRSATRSGGLSLRRVYLFDPEKLIETSSDAEMDPKFVVDLF